jgi:short-subunit dehydrogenase
MSHLNPRFGSFQNKNIWIIGASSGIGEACAKLFHSHGANLILSARRIDALESIKAACLHNNASSSKVDVISLDVNSESSIQEASKHVLENMKHIDLLLFVSGIYEPMRASDFDYQIVFNTVNTNLLGPMRVLGEMLPQFIRQGNGHIGLVSSVAGYSGLPKSLAYGPTKAALINFAESLYYDLHPKGVSVHLISPGFVATPATARNDFAMPALISPEEAALEIARGLERGEFDIHFPKRFTRFLKFLRILPYSMYFWILKKFIKI